MAVEDTTDRRNRLFETISDDIDVIILSPSKTLRYFTGLSMHKSERPTLVALFRNRSPAAVLPKLETDRVEEALPDAELYTYSDAPDPVAVSRNTYEHLAVDFDVSGPIGTEFRSTRLLEKEVFASDDTDIVDIEPEIARIRSRKDKTEIERMRTAATIIEDILEETFDVVEPGMTETQIEKEIRKRVIESDADEYGVGIVTCGERTAHAHTNTGSRAVKQGELVMIDAGVIYEGYYSDVTRTIAVSDPGKELREIYSVVQKAAEAARERVEPGVECQEIDRIAREIIEDAGYGDYFSHRVGHGLGLEGHEPPYLVEGNDKELEIGHAITVEPGIYVSELGGVRIEDDVLVSEEGADLLTTSSRDLRIL